MRTEKNNIFANIDWILIFLYLALVLFGWMNIYAASFSGSSQDFFDFSTKYGKQILWIMLSFPLIVFTLLLNGKFYEQYGSLIYLVSVISLAGVLVFGKKINGATSWYSFGSFSIQPSEFAKVFTVLAVAKLLSDRQYNLKLFKNQIKAFIIIFLPAFFIALQPDMGSVLVYFSFFFVLYREGINPIYFILGGLSIVLFLCTIYFGVTPILIVCLSLVFIYFVYNVYKDKQFIRFKGLQTLIVGIIASAYILLSGFVFNNIFKQHHRNRFDILLGKKIDTKDIGYNTYQSKLTISSGQFFGKGFLQGDRTQGDFVPEQHTDYIFSTVGEEWGFLGSTIVIILFMILLFRIIYLSEKTPNKFGRIYGYGTASVLFFHVVVNIGMVIGLLPTIGIPLPFFSYGGSGLWAFTILLFIFIRLDAHKSNEW